MDGRKDFSGNSISGNNTTNNNNSNKKQNYHHPGTSKTEKYNRDSRSNYTSASIVSVGNANGGGLSIKGPALAAWTVDAMRLIRSNLYRAGGGEILVPCGANWGEGKDFYDELPSWAMELDDGGIVITHLGDMALEVSQLLDAMDEFTTCQRARRLDRLVPKGYYRRNWYVFAVAVPTTLFALYRLVHNRSLFVDQAKKIVEKAHWFYYEHVSEPVSFIFNELFTSDVRAKITDEAGLAEAVGSLKRMLNTWMKDAYPAMSKAERERRSEKMDVSLIEDEFEKSVPNAVRNIITGEIVKMSLIQMQFIKKELLVALSAIDKLMEANEFNFKVMAMVSKRREGKGRERKGRGGTNK
jgi:hypothetical protein